MSESLDEQVIEPTEPTGGEPAVEPTSAPAEPAVEPTPEPAPPVDPTWLTEAGVPQRQEPPPQPQPQVQHPRYQPPPQTVADQRLQSFVDDPDGFIEQAVQQRLQQYVGPLAMGMQDVQRQTHEFMQTQANTGINQARSAIKNVYDTVFNQDEGFRSNKELQEQIGSTLRGLFEQASDAARMGNFYPIAALSSMSPQHARATLAAAKEMIGYKVPADAPMNIAGAVVEPTSPAVKRDEISLSSEEEQAIAAIERTRPGYRDEYLRAKKEAEKLGDFGI